MRRLISPSSRARFWEQDGQRWKTLQSEGPEVLGPTPRVRAPDSGHTPGVVPAGHEALHGLADALEAERAQTLGKLGIVASDELGEVGLE